MAKKVLRNRIHVTAPRSLMFIHRRGMEHGVAIPVYMDEKGIHLLGLVLLKRDKVVWEEFRTNPWSYDVTVHSYNDAATYCLVVECVECKSAVHCDGYTNTCALCGRDYSMTGDTLSPRSQWGADTGESLSDILAVDADSERPLSPEQGGW